LEITKKQKAELEKEIKKAANKKSEKKKKAKPAKETRLKKNKKNILPESDPVVNETDTDEDDD